MAEGVNLKLAKTTSMDRLSCLPDDVIHHILSFCPTERSVQTSVLSKRWRFHWAHVPRLSFRDYPREKSKIITKILLPYRHDIDTFMLCDKHPDYSEEVFESWIGNITTRKIRNLVLTLKHQFKLPQCLITCKTLTSLKLGGCDIPMSGIYFPALKKLSLEDVRYESNESLAQLISGCPVLEDLSIDGKMFCDCCISSPTLTRLAVTSMCFDVPGFGVKIDTPALRYLCLKIDMPHKFSVGALGSLIEADIELSWDERQHNKFGYSLNAIVLVFRLYNVKRLRLAIDPIEMCDDSDFSGLAAGFHNLTQLGVVSTLGVITIFLENNSNLRVLDLTILSMVDAGWMPEQVPACVASHLQTVTIDSFQCSEDEINFVGYILMNAKVLKRMEICTVDGGEYSGGFEALKRLALFERASPKCQLAFS